MSKVIEIKDHIESEKQQKKHEERKNLIEPLLSFLQCSSCRRKCSHCGSTADVSTNYSFPPDSIFSFCASCEAGYMEYQRLKAGDERKRAPWHNQEWIEMWDSWVDYQKALRRFRNSKEVKDFLRNLRK